MTVNEQRLAGLSILILEDEYILADEAQSLLLLAGAEVVGPFGTAAEALLAAALHRPDCALIDLHLGAGLDFGPARALRRRGVPLVFFTGYDTAVIPPDLRDERFVEKPVFMASIVEVIAEACGRLDLGLVETATDPPWRAEGLAGY